ncbi:MAG: N-acetylmuramoyl-L-alanine amidase [Myxococcota bacterium]
MRAWAMFAAVAWVVTASPALAAPSFEEAYADAREAYYALKGDAQRRQFRHHWINVAKKFERVAAKFPKSERAPDALFTAGELFVELGRLSGAREDWEAAMASYAKLVELHPKHRLADDGALALARLHLDRKADPEGARKLIEQMLSVNPDGDQAKKLEALAARLPAAKMEPAKAAPERKDVSRSPTADALLAAISKVTARRVSPVEEAAAALVPKALPKLTEVQERLREVRVGRATPGPAPEKLDAQATQEAKERLRQVAKHELGRELTLAEQLGLKVRRVVIDAGHGGHDTGAIGPSGVQEKDVALEISKKVAARLTEVGLEVVLTREDDTFLKLEERAQLANQARGDLFISVHCNSAPSKKLRGVETYSLNIASDRYSLRLAARENASTEKGINDLALILADLATKANTEESARLAAKVQRGLVSALSAKHKGIKDLGTKEALFYVLLGAKMPAILVETSFLSNPVEEKLLGSSRYQEDVATAIAEGVREFLGDRERLAKVD